MKKFIYTLKQWLLIHIQHEDRIDYMDYFSLPDVENFFTIRKKETVIDGAQYQKRWKSIRRDFNAVDQYLYEILNSEKVFQ